MPTKDHATQFRTPLDVNVSDSPGYRDFGWTTESGIDLYHLGDDYAVAAGTEVYAVGTGKVVDIQTGQVRGDPGFGNYIIMEHTLPDGTKIYSLYAHLTDIYVKEGETVYFGSDFPIGTTGNSGQTEGVTGNHLHLEISYENRFIGQGDYAGGYDDLSSPAWDGDTVDPSNFIEEYSNPGAVLRDFPPKDTARFPDETASDRGTEASGRDEARTVELDFDDLFIFNTQKLTYDGNGYWKQIEDNYDDLIFTNFAALHTPSFSDQSTGYVNGTTSGDWVAYNVGGRSASISSDKDFTLEQAVLTSAWVYDHFVYIEAYDDGQLVAAESVPITRTDPTRYYFGEDFESVDEVIFYSGGSLGEQFVLDDLVVTFDEDSLV